MVPGVSRRRKAFTSAIYDTLNWQHFSAQGREESLGNTKRCRKHKVLFVVSLRFITTSMHYILFCALALVVPLFYPCCSVDRLWRLILCCSEIETPNTWAQRV